MPTVNQGSRSTKRASAIATLAGLALLVSIAPAALAQTPGHNQRYVGPGTISGSIPTLPATIPGQAALAFDLGADPTVYAFDIKASAADQTVVFSAASIRNVVIDGDATSFDFEFEAKLRTTVVIQGNPISAETQGRVLFVGNVNADATGLIESQGPPMPVIVNGNAVGELTDFSGDLERTCLEAADMLCLNNGRFRVQIDWNSGTATGMGQVVPFGSNDSGLFYFFQPDNWEMLLKVLDSCDGFDHFWVFAAATTAVEYTITVTDTDNGTQKQYFNPLNNAAPAITDTQAFATCP